LSDSVLRDSEMESRSLHGYLAESQEWMLEAAWEEKVTVGTTDSLEEYDKRLYKSSIRD